MSASLSHSGQRTHGVTRLATTLLLKRLLDMSKVKKIFTNTGSTAAYAVISAVFTLFPEDFFKLGFIGCDWSESAVVLTNRIFVCLVFFLLGNISYYCWRKHRKVVTITDKDCTIEIMYGNLIKINEGKKVIHFDECFTTTVGTRPEDVKADSVCGQYLRQHPITETEVSSLINLVGIKSTGTSLYNKKEKYTHGILLPREEFLLMAYAKLDKNGLGIDTYEKYVECLDKLWEQIDLHHGTADVYLPIIGSKITRFDKDLTQQQLLDIMIASYRLSPKKMKHPYKLHIVCKEREGFSLNNIFGVE